MKKSLVSLVASLALSTAVCANSDISTYIIDQGKYEINGYYASYDFDGDRKIDRSDWVYLDVKSGNMYQLMGKKTSEDNIFGWKKINGIDFPNPSYFLIYLNDWDNDKDKRFDWIVISEDGKDIYKLDGRNEDGSFRYSNKLDLSLDITSDKKIAYFAKNEIAKEEAKLYEVVKPVSTDVNLNLSTTVDEEELKKDKIVSKEGDIIITQEIKKAKVEEVSNPDIVEDNKKLSFQLRKVRGYIYIHSTSDKKVLKIGKSDYDKDLTYFITPYKDFISIPDFNFFIFNNYMFLTGADIRIQDADGNDVTEDVNLNTTIFEAALVDDKTLLTALIVSTKQNFEVWFYDLNSKSWSKGFDLSRDEIELM